MCWQLSVGGIAGYSEAIEKFKTNQLLNDLTHLVTNIQTISFNKNENKYSWINNSYGQLNNILGIYNALDLDKYKHIFNSYIELSTGYGYRDNDQNSFSIILSGLPKQPCIEIAATYWGTNTGFIGLSVGDHHGNSDVYFNKTLVENCDVAKVEDNSYKACAPKTPISVSIAAEWCTSSTRSYTGYSGIALYFK